MDIGYVWVNRCNSLFLEFKYKCFLWVVIFFRMNKEIKEFFCMIFLDYFYLRGFEFWGMLYNVYMKVMWGLLDIYVFLLLEF